MQQPLDIRDYATVGKLYAQHNPDHALSLLNRFKASQAAALDTDLHHLNAYFTSFCALHDINPLEYTGALIQTSKIDKRRLFIGCMIRIYMPHLLTYNLRYRNGFRKGLSGVLCYDAGNLCKAIDEAVAWMKSDYDGFNSSVDELVEHLTKGNDKLNKAA